MPSHYNRNRRISRSRVVGHSSPNSQNGMGPGQNPANNVNRTRRRGGRVGRRRYQTGGHTHQHDHQVDSRNLTHGHYITSDGRQRSKWVGPGFYDNPMWPNAHIMDDGTEIGPPESAGFPTTEYVSGHSSLIGHWNSPGTHGHGGGNTNPNPMRRRNGPAMRRRGGRVRKKHLGGPVHDHPHRAMKMAQPRGRGRGRMMSSGRSGYRRGGRIRKR